MYVYAVLYGTQSKEGFLSSYRVVAPTAGDAMDCFHQAFPGCPIVEVSRECMHSFRSNHDPYTVDAVWYIEEPSQPLNCAGPDHELAAVKDVS